MTERRGGSDVGKSVSRLVGGCLISQLDGWLVGRLVSRLISWLVGWSVSRLVSWLVGLVGRSGWLVGRSGWSIS